MMYFGNKVNMHSRFGIRAKQRVSVHLSNKIVLAKTTKLFSYELNIGIRTVDIGSKSLLISLLINMAPKSYHTLK